MPKGKKGFQKGHEQFNSGNTHFKKGMIPWNKGGKFSEESKKKMSVSHKGKSPWNKGLKTGLVPKTAFKKGYKLSKEAKEKMKGRTPWNKLEFRIPYPYEFNNTLKEQIRNRDNCECKLCFIGQEEINKKLIVHHVDFDKNNNSEFNLISLCRNCHGKVHCMNNLIWVRFFQNKLNVMEVKNAIRRRLRERGSN
ncbi:MAG: NUMOD3 domain-containing DNA-binding protein [Nitrosopumilus sp.]